MPRHTGWARNRTKYPRPAWLAPSWLRRIFSGGSIPPWLPIQLALHNTCPECFSWYKPSFFFGKKSLAATGKLLLAKAFQENFYWWKFSGRKTSTRNISSGTQECAAFSVCMCMHYATTLALAEERTFNQKAIIANHGPHEWVFIIKILLEHRKVGCDHV